MSEIAQETDDMTEQLIRNNRDALKEPKIKAILDHQALEVKASSEASGYGIFAQSAIEKDSIIEECRTLLLSGPIITGVRNHYFESHDYTLLPLGFGALYNHSDTPNAVIKIEHEHRLLILYALQGIPAGEEVTINYGKNWKQAQAHNRHIIVEQKRRKHQSDRTQWLKNAAGVGVLLMVVLFAAFYL